MCPQVPEDFTMAYGAGQDELEVGGVFLRIFIAQPGWVLRKPREFLVSLLETLTELLEKNNPNVSGLTEKQKHSFWCFHFSLCCLNTSDFHLFPDHLRSPAGWGPGDGYHRSSVSVQHTEPAGRPGSSSGSPASGPGSTQPQEQQRAQELHPPPPCAIRQWGEERNVSIVQSLPFYLLHVCDRNKGVKFKFKVYIYRQESEKNCWKASWELSNQAIFVLSHWVCFISAPWHTN